MLSGIGKINLLLLPSWMDKIIEFFTGFLAFIPMSIYFIYTSCTSVLDMFQYLIRKLAGLDVYYVNGEKQEGDILIAFVKGILGIEGSTDASYSTLSTVFWSLIIFSVILLVLTTIISVIKAHYNYDSKKSQPMTIITGSIKALFTMAIVPIVTIFGLSLSQVILNYLDMLTSAASGTNIASLFGSETNLLQVVGTTSAGDNIYASYDCFGFGGATSQVTFSGTMFELAAYDCNRVRTGSYGTKTATNSSWTDFGIFIDPDGGDAEDIAKRIDCAFANRLTVKKWGWVTTTGADSWILNSAFLYGQGAAFGAPLLVGTNTFSKYNVGLVFYYYNLWTFNYFVAFAGMAALFTILINIIFGLIGRLIYCLALFLIYSPLVGIIPLDGGNGFKSWKKAFIENVLMAYGAIVGMNIFFLILPFFNTLSFFGPGLGLLDKIMNILIIISGLSLVKKFMKMLSGFIGAADANETGKAIADDVKATGMKAAGMTMKAAGLGVAAGKLGFGIAKGIGGAVGSRVSNAAAKRHSKKMQDANYKKKYEEKQRDKAKKAADREKERQKKQDDKIRDAFGYDKNHEVTAKDRKRFSQRQAYLKHRPKDVSKKEVEALFKNGGDAKEIARFSTEHEMSDRIMNNKTRGNAFQRLTHTTDENGDLVRGEDGKTQIKPGLQAFGSGMIDVSQASLKLAGDITGIGKFAKELGETGVIDTAKDTIFSFGQAIGAFTKGDDGKAKRPDALKTKKDKEDAEKDAVKETRKAQAEAAENARKQLDAIKELNKKLQDMEGRL